MSLSIYGRDELMFVSLSCLRVLKCKSSNSKSNQAIMAVKKGDMVRAVREKLENSLEAQASDSRFPSYLFETKGEVLDIKDDYALVVFGQVPTPNVWLRVDQLEAFK
ncbi:MAG TPA: NAD(P)H-quinone oxidoreductase subunit O [Leptolyngbyaceae cyanobacterium]